MCSAWMPQSATTELTPAWAGSYRHRMRGFCASSPPACAPWENSATTTLEPVMDRLDSRPQVSGMMTARKPYPSDVSDEEWALAVPYLTLLPETAGQRTH